MPEHSSILKDPLRTLNTLISNLPGFVYRCANDPQWTMSYISEGCIQVTGYAPDDFIDNKTLAFSDIIHPDYLMWPHWQETITKHLPFEHEYPITTRSGETRWVWERGRGIFGDDGELLYLEGFITDITSRKEAEMRLAASEEQYRHLFELSPVAISLVDMQGTILQVNSAYCKMSGYDFNELIGQDIRMLVPTERLHMVDEHINQMQSGATLEHEVYSLTREGELRIKLLRERAVPLPNGEKGILTMASDITEQKQGEQALLRSEKRYRSLVEHMLEGMAIVDGNGDVLLWNPALLAIFGIKPEEIAELMHTTVYDFVHPDYAYDVKFDIAHVLNGNDVTRQYQFISPATGRAGWMEVHATKIDYDGTDAMLVLMRDITIRKQEDELREYLSWHDSLTNLYNRSYFERIMREIPSNSTSIVVADLDGLKIINDTLGHQSGDELLKRTANILLESSPAHGYAARIGGDEFAIIIPETNPAQVAAVVNDIRHRQEEHNLQHPDLPISLSLGYHVGSTQGEGLYDTFKAADNLMYREKLFHHQSSRSTLIHALMGALESKNLETRAHVERIGELARLIAHHIKLPEYKLMDLDLFAKFHDIGKVGVADSILNKQGPLTPEERAEIERHSEIGYRIAVSSPELASIAEYILKHHEWWNGAGYPLGIKGTEIPLECRIVAIVDAYDAMTSDRPYRKALCKAQAIAEVKRCAGVQFDPSLVDVFLSVI